MFAPLTASGGRVHVELADLSNKAETDRAIGAITGALGAPTILVNNAGMGSSPAAAGNENGRFEDYPEAAWDTMIDSHLKTTLFASQAFIRHFRAAQAQAAGSIINVSSTYGVVSPDQSIYEYKRDGGADVLQAGRLQRGEVGRAELHALAGGVRRAARHSRQHAGARRRAEDGHAPEFVHEYEKRTPLGRMANGFRLQRRGAVPRLARLFVHDRRHARRGRRMDGSVDSSSSSISVNRFRLTYG